MSKKITENERAAFDAWHFNDWNDNCGHEFDEVEAKHLYNRVYSHEHNRRERERSFFAWQAATDRANKKTEGCVVVPSNSVTLTCEQLLTVLRYGAPDLHVERTEYSEEQMETEMSIVWLEDGHSGKGYYAYYTELPEEGSINIDLMEEAARGGNE